MKLKQLWHDNDNVQIQAAVICLHQRCRYCMDEQNRKSSHMIPVHISVKIVMLRVCSNRLAGMCINDMYHILGLTLLLARREYSYPSAVQLLQLS